MLSDVANATGTMAHRGRIHVSFRSGSGRMETPARCAASHMQGWVRGKNFAERVRV
jgi:hypothetical protein